VKENGPDDITQCAAESNCRQCFYQSEFMFSTALLKLY